MTTPHLVTQDDYNNVGDNDEARTVWSIAGGILYRYQPEADGTYAFRVRVQADSQTYEIWEYQYTHVGRNGDLTTRVGEYVAAGTFLGNYMLTRRSGDIAHVHAVIRRFIDIYTEDLSDSATAIADVDNRYMAPGISAPPIP